MRWRSGGVDATRKGRIMSHRATVLAATMAGVCAVGPASAAEPIRCDARDLRAVPSLAALPPEIATILGRQDQDNGIADIGEKFNATDLHDGANPPNRRFGYAAASTSCAYVAVERGGRGYSVEVWAFQFDGERWRGELRSGKVPRFTLPRSVAELVAQADM
jgi:hypothetical protein